MATKKQDANQQAENVQAEEAQAEELISGVDENALDEKAFPLVEELPDDELSQDEDEGAYLLVGGETAENDDLQDMYGGSPMRGYGSTGSDSPLSLNEKAKDEEGSEDEAGADEPAPANRTTPRSRRRVSPGIQQRDSENYRAMVASQNQAEAGIFRERKARQAQKNLTIGSARTLMRNRTVIAGTVSSVEGNSAGVYLCCYLESLKVIIPFSEVFANPPQDLVVPAGHAPTEAILRRQRLFLQKLLGANISFILTEIDTDGSNVVASASRKQALNAQAFAHYVMPGRLHVQEGNTVNGSIISVSTYTMTVCVCGIDLVLANRQITNRYIPDLTQRYMPGDTIPLQIRKLTVTGGKVTELVVSGKAPEWEALKENLWKIRKDGSYAARVVSIANRNDANGVPHLLVNLFLEQIELPAFASELYANMGSNLVPGDYVRFRVHGLSSKSGYPHGRIEGFLGRK